MRCNQCEALMINGLYCHETGCPNTHKIYDKEEGRWVNPPVEFDEEEFESEYGDYGEYPDYDALGPTGHGDICLSDADPGL